MGRFKTSAAFVAAGIAAGACAPTEDRLTPVSNPTLYSLNQPVVQRTDYVFDVASTGDGIPDTERARLDNWFQSLQIGYGDRIFVDDSSGYPDPRTRQDIADVAASYGILLGKGAPVTAGGVLPGSVRIVVSRATASVPGCPIWEDPQIGQSTRTSTNYGCATNSNLAQMIADPNDLVLGQTAGDRNGAAGAKAVGNYVKRVPTGVSGAVKAEAGAK